MGFLSSITGGSKTKVPASGFFALPKPIQRDYSSIAARARDNFYDYSIYSPTQFNADQNQAFSMAQPLDAQGVSNLVSTYQNPYDSSVINDINKQATGANSTLNQSVTQAGQFGSNRQLLGANDIDQSRLNQINTFEQGQFNNSLATGLQQRQQGFSNLLNVGNQQQEQDTAIKQAPLAASQGLAAALQSYMQGFTPGSSQAKTVKTGGGLGGILNLAKTAASTYAAF